MLRINVRTNLKIFGDEQRLALPGSGEQGELLGWGGSVTASVREKAEMGVLGAHHGRLIMHTGEELSSSVHSTHTGSEKCRYFRRKI